MISVLEYISRGLFHVSIEDTASARTLARPYAANKSFDVEEQVKSLSQALKEMMRKELLNGKEV